MFWNEITVDMMILVYIAGLFALILICMYALIQSKANSLYTFIIIPLALLMASMTWQGIKLLQGMPVYGLPVDEKVEILYVQDNKPWIFVLLKEENGPVLYKIDWSEENKKKMKELQSKIGSSFAQGKFKIKGNKGESKSLHFNSMEDMTEPDYKDGQEDERTFEAEDTRDGVSYSTPSARPSSTPSLEVGNNETRFIKGERKHIPWSTQFLFTNRHEEDETVYRPLNEGEE
jgi:hypothetical protein